MSNIYEYFNCKSKEELYEKVRNEDPSVQSLNDFISFVKGNDIFEKNKAITNPAVVAEYINNVQPPKSDEMVVVFTNVKNRPLHICRMNPSCAEDVRHVLKEGIITGSMCAFFVTGENVPDWRIEKTKELFGLAKITILDDFLYIDSQNALFSNEALQKFSLNEVNNEEKSTNIYQTRGLEKLAHYIEFVPYYASNKITGLNILDDIESIKSFLKLGFQHHEREVFGVIIYDQHNEVLSMTELFKGGIVAVVVDSRVLAKEVIQTNGYGFAIFHNHPSGVPLPNEEDLELTESIKRMSEVLELEFLDHFIVGKEGVFSIAEKVDGLQSSNLGYQTYIKSKTKIKREQLNGVER